MRRQVHRQELAGLLGDSGADLWAVALRSRTPPPAPPPRCRQAGGAGPQRSLSTAPEQIAGPSPGKNSAPIRRTGEH